MKIHFFQSFNRFSSMLTNWGKTLIRSANVVYLREEQLRGVTTEPILSQNATLTLRTNYFYKYFWPWKPQSYYCFFVCTWSYLLFVEMICVKISCGIAVCLLPKKTTNWSTFPWSLFWIRIAYGNLNFWQHNFHMFSSISTYHYV